MRLTCLLLLAAVFCSAGWTEPEVITIAGKALAVDGKPVANVRAVFMDAGYPSPQQWEARSGEDGAFSLAIPADKPLNLQLRSVSLASDDLAPVAATPQGPLQLSPGQTISAQVVCAPCTARLAGMVKDPEGAPVAGAVLSLIRGPFFQATLAATTATTDAEGRYAFPHLAPGTYIIKSVVPPAGSPLIRLQTWRPFGVRQVALVDQEAKTEDFTLPRGACLSGRVLDLQGKPLAGIPVRCETDAATEVGPPSRYQAPGQWYNAESVTDDQGQYTLTGLTQETYRLQFTAPEGANLAPVELRGISVMAGKDLAVQDVALSPGGIIDGTVTAPDGTPVAGATVKWTAMNAPLPAPQTAGILTGDDGRFTLKPFATGKYRLFILPPAGSGLSPQVFPDTMAVRGQTLAYTFSLLAGVTVSGTVLDPEGNPVAGATVMPSVQNLLLPAVTTNENGEYTITGLPAMKLQAAPDPTISAQPPDDRPALAPIMAKLPDPAPGEAPRCDLVLKPACAITGQVTDQEGKPVPGCKVSAFEQLRAAIAGYGEAFTGADGRFVLAGLPAKTVSVLLTPPPVAKLARLASAPVTLAAGATQTVDLALQPGTSVFGKAMYEDGTPAPGMLLRLQYNGKGPTPLTQFMPDYPTAISGPDGTFRFDAILPGAYNLTWTPYDPAYAQETKPIGIGTEPEQQVDVEVKCVKPAR